MNKINIKRIIFLILIMINCVVIFNFSAQKADESSSTSGKVVDVVMAKIYKNNSVPQGEEIVIRDRITTIVRKGAHFSIYTCLGIFTYLYTGTYNLNKKKRVLYTIAFCFTYACSDEFHQKFVDGRSGEIRDVCIDTCGAFFGCMVIIAISKLNQFVKMANI